MPGTAQALGLLAFLSLAGLLGPAFAPDERGVLIMLTGLVLFVVFAGLAALSYFTAEGES